MHGKMDVKQKINEKERVIWTYRLRERDSLHEKMEDESSNMCINTLECVDPKITT